MNADRIVVVEHGELVEQGSHNELIVANGRYADLWSKQTFLKPLKNSSSEGLASIVDVPLKQTTAELFKVTSHGSESVAESSDADGPKETLSTPKHKREVEPTRDDTSLADSNLTL